MDHKALAAFDLDHTLIKKNISYVFGKYLFSQGHMPFYSMLRFSLAYGCHKILGFPIIQLHQTVLNHYFKFLNKKKLNGWIEDFLDQELSHLWNSNILEKLKKAQEQGSIIALLSSSPNFLVEPIAKRLNISHWGATSYSLDGEEKYSEILYIVDGSYKAAFLVEMIKRYGLAKEAVFAYSDSYLDIDMLQAAGHPIAVNPDRKLRAYCHRKSWPIL